MDPHSSALRGDQPAAYQVSFQGRAQVDWSDWLRGLTINVEVGDEGQPPVTTLAGTVPDQAALFGLLSRIRDFGLPLLLVEYLGPEP
jgi:hypothetical protein